MTRKFAARYSRFSPLLIAKFQGGRTRPRQPRRRRCMLRCNLTIHWHVTDLPPHYWVAAQSEGRKLPKFSKEDLYQLYSSHGGSDGVVGESPHTSAATLTSRRESQRLPVVDFSSRLDPFTLSHIIFAPLDSMTSEEKDSRLPTHRLLRHRPQMCSSEHQMKYDFHAHWIRADNP